ncbi:odorant receptor 9a-like isoform X2 [Leptopilina boulardi]|uniref:odorant receptor 9a-like isoform X2 n=1 Tax=Leptopilina boulardi TaxID=63433 RepID=UPI0021F54104|nr:odorant receptor 9a-like isoform X2 [Leptopilina boulardi]
MDSCKERVKAYKQSYISYYIQLSLCKHKKNGHNKKSVLQYYQIYYNCIRTKSISGQVAKYLNKIILFVYYDFFYYCSGFIKVSGNIDLMLLCIPPMNVVFGKMQNDWETLKSKREVDILHKYGRQCRFYTILSFIGSFGHATIYVFSHLIPLVINLFRNNHEHRPANTLFEYGLDAEKYYYSISIHNYVAAFACTVAFVNGDTLLYMFLEHACGIFEILGHKLTTAIKENPDSNNNVSFQKKLQGEIKICVSMHRRLLLFVNDVQEVLSTAYLFIFGLSIIDLSITGVQYVMSAKGSGAGIRFGTYAICQVFHIFFLTLPTQHLLDNSLSLSSSIYNSDWFNLSMKTKKLLLIIMIRECKPTTFVVGRIFVLSFQTFTKVLQTSMSYFTVLMSVQE